MDCNFDVACGSRRFVFMFNDRVYKIPRLDSWVAFIRGINENLEERYWYSADGSRKRNPDAPWNHERLAEIFWADRFGFIVIMRRADTYHRPITFDDELKQLQDLFSRFSFADDVVETNVGYIDNRLVMIDYGFFGGTMDCYIGT